MRRNVRSPIVNLMASTLDFAVKTYQQTRSAVLEPPKATADALASLPALLETGGGDHLFAGSVRFRGKGVVQIEHETAPVYLLVESLTFVPVGRTEDAQLEFQLELSSAERTPPTFSPAWVDPTERGVSTIGIIPGQITSGGEEIFTFSLRGDKSFTDNLQELADFASSQADRLQEQERGVPDAFPPGLNLDWLAHNPELEGRAYRPEDLAKQAHS